MKATTETTSLPSLPMLITSLPSLLHRQTTKITAEEDAADGGEVVKEEEE